MTKVKKQKSYEIDMINGPLLGKILLFALPLMLSSVLQLLFNAADIIVVGRFVGSEALAAVGSTGSLINLLVNWFLGLSVGTNVVVARDLGSNRTEEVGRSVHTSIAFALICGVALSIFGVVMCRQMLVLMDSPEDVIDLSTLYLRIYFCGMPANTLYNFGAAILRAKGDTRRPLYYLTFAGVVNVCLNLVFVTVFHMSVAGVGLATISSQYISAILVILTLMREDGPLHLNLKKLRVELPVVRRILRIGLPAGLQTAIFAISNVVVQSSINSFGSVVVAGASAAGNIEGFVYVCMNCFCQSAMTFTSQNYSAGKTKRVDRIMILSLACGTVAGLIVGNLAYFFGETLVGIYAPGKPDVIAAAVSRMAIIAAPYFLCGLMDIQVGVLRGLGYSVVPMIVSMVGACGTRLLWVATIFQVYRTPEVLYYSYPVSWTLTALVHFGFFLLVRKHAYSKAEQLQSF